jgi:hypothetical protein
MGLMVQVRKVAEENGVDVSEQMVELEKRADEVRLHALLHAAAPRRRTCPRRMVFLSKSDV